METHRFTVNMLSLKEIQIKNIEGKGTIFTNAVEKDVFVVC